MVGFVIRAQQTLEARMSHRIAAMQSLCMSAALVVGEDVGRTAEKTV